MQRNPEKLALWRSRPDWVEPMLPSSSEPQALPGGWLWEPKLAGERCQVWTSAETVQLRSASGRPLTERHADLVRLAGAAARGDTILDAVITPSALYVFDCMFYEGASIAPLPLLERKAVLRDAVWFSDRIRFMPYRTSGPEAERSDESVSSAIAGLVAKRLASSYVGGRSPDWLAFDSAQAQEFVIGGYTELAGASGGLALLIGYYDQGRLRYAGRVSATCHPMSFAAVLPTLVRLRRRTSPFGGAVPGATQIQWVSPALVAQIGFSEWTPAGLPRRPRFIGLRHDREPDEVRREAVGR